MSIETRLDDIEKLLARIMQALGLDEATPQKPVPVTDPEVDVMVSRFGFITSDRIKREAKRFEEMSGGYKAPIYFLPDLPEFSQRRFNRTSVLDKYSNLSDATKAMYWFTVRDMGIMAWFLGKRKPYAVSEVVPAGKGTGAVVYGHQATGNKMPQAWLVPDVSTEAAAFEYQKKYMADFMEFDTWYEARG